MESSIGSLGVAKFILSRFNLYIPKFREMAGLGPDNYLTWCERRVELFRQYTLPSIAAQSNTQFRWIIYFDTELNAPIERLLSDLKSYDFAVPVLLNLRGRSVAVDMISQIGVDLRRLRPPGAKYFCTTRLDTDDALGIDFVSNLNSHLHRMTLNEYPENRVALTFPVGSQCWEDRFNMYVYDRNPFISLIELCDMGDENSLRSVFSFAHYDVEKVARLYRALTTTPQWLQTIHGGNAANEWKDDLPALCDDRALAWFGLHAIKSKILGQTGADSDNI